MNLRKIIRFSLFPVSEVSILVCSGKKRGVPRHRGKRPCPEKGDLPD